MTGADPLAGFARSHPFAIIYDGQCPFCSAYATKLRLERAVGDVRLIDARQEPELVRRLGDAGYDINDGMVVFNHGQINHGEHAMHILSLFSTRSGLFNALTGWLFADERRSRLIYPLFRFCRRITLAVLRRPAL